MPSLLRRARLALARKIAPARTGSRSFNAAQVGRLTADWIAAATSADSEIRGAFRRLVDRSRDLERNNDYMRGFLLSAERNINGAQRYDLRSDAGEWINRPRAGTKPAQLEWQPDDMAKRAIEDAWSEWGRKGTCTVCKRHTWRGVRRLAVRSVIRDGNFLARKLRGAAARNRFGFALQLWEIDHLDTDKFGSAAGGNEIRFGVEIDSMGAPVAYWLRARHPGDYASGGREGYTSTRFPADEIYHLSRPDRAEQTIAYPWVVSAITRLRQLGAFEEAAVVAARLGASNAVFFETTGEGEWTGEQDSEGRAVMDIEPGVAQQLPQGWKASAYTPQYPNIETGDFRKAMLRGVATSLGASYTTVGNDLESVNFSSARVGLFDEREGWKDLQLFFSEELWEQIFADWLEQSILAGALALPLAKFAKFNRPVFKARRWPFIKPGEEMEAAQKAIALRLTSRQQLIEESGGDIEDTFHDAKADEMLAAKIGLSLTPADPMPEAFGEVLPKGADPEEDADAPDTPAKKKASSSSQK
jgi:lambda family phage portal protein